jgi:hypothetical protein
VAVRAPAKPFSFDSSALMRPLRVTLHGAAVPIRYLLRAFAVAGLLQACARERPDELTIDTITIDDPVDPPCRLVLETTGVELHGNLTGSEPDPGMGAVRDSRGRYLTSMTQEVGVAVWSASGHFERIIGSEGRGPGELVRGYSEPFVTADDSIFIRDNSLSWSVFTRDGAFVRRFSGRYLGSDSRNAHFLPDGTILSTTAAAAADKRALFHIADRAGQHLRSFGEVEPDDTLLFSEGLLFLVSEYSGDSTFWTAARAGSDHGYQLVQWSLDGKVLREIHRNTPWFETGPWPPVEGQRPSSQVIAIHLDTEGLLLVHVSGPNKRWRPSTHDSQPANTSEFYDQHYEVIDPDRGQVLVSALAEDRLAIPVRYFGHTRDGYKSRMSGEGLEYRDIVRYRIEPLDRRRVGHNPCR